MTSTRPATSEIRPLPIPALVGPGAEFQTEDGRPILLVEIAVLSASGEAVSFLVLGNSLPEGVFTGDELLVRFELRACRVCGCTSSKPCRVSLASSPDLPDAASPTCEWVEGDLCSTCSGPVILSPSGNPARENP